MQSEESTIDAASTKTATSTTTTASTKSKAKKAAKKTLKIVAPSDASVTEKKEDDEKPKPQPKSGFNRLHYIAGFLVIIVIGIGVLFQMGVFEPELEEKEKQFADAK